VTRWLEGQPLQEWAFKATYANHRTTNRDNQDLAAAPHGRTLILDDGGTATAMIRLRRRPRGRRTYASLRWTSSSKRKSEINVCEVTESNRLDNLKQAWATVHTLGLLTPHGRQQHRERRHHEDGPADDVPAR
jgi:DNA mismatch endonuclease (patch repair protein)